MEKKLLVALVDAFSFHYLSSMPRLERWFAHGQIHGARVCGGFHGVEPLLNGQWQRSGETPFHFRRGQSPFRYHHLMAIGDRLLPSLPAKVWRLLLARWGRFPHPQLIPVPLLSQLSHRPDHGEVSKVIQQWERRGRRVWWYTRDSQYEHCKAWTARVYRHFYRHRMLAEAQAALAGNYQVVYLEFSNLLDAVGHALGPDSEGIKKTLDRFEEELLAWLDSMQLVCPNLDIAVISDHGMSPVIEGFDLEKEIQNHLGYSNGKEYLAVWNSCLAQIWCTGSYQSELENFLGQLGYGEVVSDSERESWFGLDRDDGDILFAVHEGSVLFPNHFQGRRWVRGMHGYLTTQTDFAKALCLFRGDGFSSLDFPEQKTLVDLHPLLADWCG